MSDQVHNPVPDIVHLHAKDEYIDDAYRTAADLIKLVQACYSLGRQEHPMDADITLEHFEFLLKSRTVEFGPELTWYLKGLPKERPLTGEYNLLFHIERRVLEILRLRDGGSSTAKEGV